MATHTSAQSQEPHLRRHIGIVGLLFASVGSIIGSGWLFGALNASVEAGPAAVISWAIGGVMILLIALVYAELGTMFPLSGGVVLSRPTLDYARLDKAAFLDAMRGLIADEGGRGADDWMAVDLLDATAMDARSSRSVSTWNSSSAPRRSRCR